MAMAYHPGTVKTGLSKEFWGNVKEENLFKVGYAVERILEVTRGVGIEGRGRCWDWKGRRCLLELGCEGDAEEWLRKLGASFSMERRWDWNEAESLPG